MTAVVVVLAAAVVMLAVLVAGLLRSHAEILRALHELGAGLELDRGGAAPAGPQPLVLQPYAPVRPDGDDRPDGLSGTTLDDEAVALSLRGADTLLAFLSSGCATCSAFWDAFARGVDDVPGGARLVVVAQGPAEESPAALRERAPAGVPLVLSSEAWTEFRVPGSPYFAYVDGTTGRVVGEGSAASWPQVADLLRSARADDAARRRRDAGRAGGGAHRTRRDDDELASAGITAGHPSLWTGTGEDRS